MACFLVPATESGYRHRRDAGFARARSKDAPEVQARSERFFQAARKKRSLSRRSSAGFPTCSGAARSCLRLSTFGTARSSRGSHS